MSKLSFRARALDASKPMPIYMAKELPDLSDYSAINRAVPQMPSGMEKEEECEHHLQRAICKGLIIPTPEVADLSDMDTYDRIYPSDYKMPRQLIHMQPFAMEQDVPDYDMDSEDEMWFNAQKNKLDLTPLKFEEMMDRLEKGSGQTVLTVQEAKALLKDDDDLILAVYDYWLNKRLKTQHPLIPMVRTEHRAGSVANNPYVAFRRRTEKMQTRKNRKNDEASYEKMLKLRRDLSRAVTLLELVKRREKSKRELLHLTVEVFEKRYQGGDFSGQLLAEVSTVKPSTRPAFAPLFTNQFGINHQNWPAKDEVLPRKEKRQYKKRKHKTPLTAGGGAGAGPGLGGAAGRGGSAAAAALGYGLDPLGLADAGGGLLSSEDEGGDAGSAGGLSDEEESGAAGGGSDPAEGPFAFRRHKHCSYHAPLAQGLGNWPWCGREEGGLADRRYRFCLASLATPPPGRCLGLVRRRLGRGGRVILDRAATPHDDLFSDLDFTILDSAAPAHGANAAPAAAAPAAASDGAGPNPLLAQIRSEWLHFRPKTPPAPAPAASPEEAEAEALLPAWLDPASIRLEVEAVGGADANGGAGPSEFSLADVLAAAAGEPPLLDLGLEAAEPPPPAPAPEPPDIGCSRFVVHPGPRRPLASAALAAQLAAGVGLLVPVAGPVGALARQPQQQPQQPQQPQRKRHRHHHHHHHPSAGRTGSVAALSNGVGAQAAAAAAAAAASPLLAGLSNGPTAGPPGRGRPAQPLLLLKQEIKQEPVAAEHSGPPPPYNSEYDAFRGAVGEGTGAADAAAAACAEQQKLKAGSGAQQQLPMEVT